jgi:hypothetical protein
MIDWEVKNEAGQIGHSAAKGYNVGAKNEVDGRSHAELVL